MLVGVVGILLNSLVVIKDLDLDLEENSPPSGGLLNWTT